MRRAFWFIPIALWAALAPPQVTFRDIAGRAGLNAVISSGGTPKNYVLEVLKVRTAAAAAGLALSVIMVSSTTAVLDYSDMDLSGVDPGRLLYGVAGGAASARGARLRPAFQSLKTRLIMRKSLGPAETGGHPPPFAVTAGMSIGILPIGWGDGLPRPLPAGSCALIRGRRAPLLDPIHLEHLRIDLTDHPEARPGDEVVLIGRQGDAEIPLDEVLSSWRMDSTTFHASLRDHIERRYTSGASAQRRAPCSSIRR
jgi:alanine racemase